MLDLPAGSLSAAAKVLEPFFGHIKRVYREQQAARLSSTPELDLLNRSFDETLGRIVQGQVDARWWENLLNAIEQPLVAPAFLRSPTLQEWLRLATVQDDLKAEARTSLLVEHDSGGDNRVDRYQRLSAAYETVTGERRELAAGPIQVVVSILVAGYVASISSALMPLAGMIQAVGTDTRDGLQRLEQEVVTLGVKLQAGAEDAITTTAHAAEAERRLAAILKARSFNLEVVRGKLRLLYHAVTEGDLRYVPPPLRARVQYWVARVHASSKETMAVAQDLLQTLERNSPERDTRIVRAFMCEAKGDIDSALNMLRDLDDADARAVVFGLLARHRGRRIALDWLNAQDGVGEPSHLTPLGWFHVAICLCEDDAWDKAAAVTRRVEALWDEWPDLAFLDGVVNCGLLLPPTMRSHALRMNIVQPGLRPSYGQQVSGPRARASDSLERAVAALQLLGDVGEDRAEVARIWILWLKLTSADDANRETAEKELRDLMKNARRAIELLPIAQTFEIQFDAAPITRYLSHRATLGPLSAPETVAEVILNEIALQSADFAEFLERDFERLRRVLPLDGLVGKRIEALIASGQATKAADVLSSQEAAFEAEDFTRLSALIAANSGQDPRADLERLYSQTHSLLDLKNLITYLSRIPDWEALQPLLRKLFELERTPDNAEMLIDCFKHTVSGPAAIVEFFRTDREIATWSENLAAEQAWAFFENGQLREAKTALSPLLARRRHAADTHLDLNIALQTGDWERLSAIVEREWDVREACQPGLLLRLASAAAEADVTPKRAMELARLAAKRAPNDARTLVSAYSLALQLGCEDEADPYWLQRAAELSGASGPVYRSDYKTFVEETIPASQRRSEEVNTKLLKGEIPIHLVAAALNLPLSRLLLDMPRRNELESDGRRRFLLPVFSAARQSFDIDPNEVVAFDVTSLMLLTWLGILDETLSSFRSTRIPAGTLIFLLNERRRVRFHQPSQVRKAEKVRALITQRRILVDHSLPKPPDWLITEVGDDLAQLLQAAHEQKGLVLYGGAIYKPGAYMEQKAELKEYASVVATLPEFFSALRDTGRISQAEYESAIAAMRRFNVDTSPDASGRSSGLWFADQLAISHLLDASLLEVVTRPGTPLHVHPLAEEHYEQLIDVSTQGEWLAQELDRMRIVLKEAWSRGNLDFLPRSAAGSDIKPTATLGELLQNITSYGVVCVDDRFVNRVQHATDEAGTPRPIACTLDVLRCLESIGSIAAATRITLEHRLRGGGLAFTAIGASELKRLVRSAQLDESGDIVELAELRVLRQYLARLRSVEILQSPMEEPFLSDMQRVAIEVIRDLWEQPEVSKVHALAASKWIWRHVCPNPIEWLPALRRIDHAPHAQIALASYLKPLVTPLVGVAPERMRVFLQWLDSDVLGPLLPANSDLLRLLTDMCKSQLEELDAAIQAQTC